MGMHTGDTKYCALELINVKEELNMDIVRTVNTFTARKINKEDITWSGITSSSLEVGSFIPPFKVECTGYGHGNMCDQCTTRYCNR